MNDLTRDAALIAQEINQIKADFERLMDKLNETETEDEALAAKYRTAFGKAMRMMAERVG